jgi:hypothetical protein
LGRIGGPTAREALEEYLDDDNETLALAAEEALDELNLFDEPLVLYDFDVEEMDEEDDEFGDIDLDHPNGRDKHGNYLN